MVNIGEEDKILYNAAIGMIAFLILLLVLKPAETFHWVSREFILKAVALFFIIPISFSIISMSFPKETLVVFGIGGILYILYTLYSNIGLMDSFVLFLQTVIEITLISIALKLGKKYAEKYIPP